MKLANCHLKLMRLWRSVTLLAMLSCCWAEPARAAEPLVFPWGQATAPVAHPSAAAYAILPRGGGASLPAAVYRTPVKSGYAYGWFGSHPARYAPSHWGRHFGYSQNFTQWTAR